MSARHYLGWTENYPRRRVLDRLALHLDGRGACIVRAAVARGITVELVRVFHDETRDDERRRKRAGNFARLCPVCNPQAPPLSLHRPRRLRRRGETAGTDTGGSPTHQRPPEVRR